ncbi:Trihelix transcription factor GT-1 [Vitis vinifera]|uniref:Trihelix transcription factor GT-1 n=1 Tax=Vitis vinifera TaxID=29760 RepID=A0A438CS09_VITVI|nr:Trihelix transcription factor GT-1 [Vitis vinifera]RVW25996.1 Trihelix transcription factor GT-1 [Vitis vinifera]
MLKVISLTFDMLHHSKCYHHLHTLPLYKLMKHFTWFTDGRKARFNSEKVMDYDQHSLGISEAEVVAANGLPPWNRKETPGSGTENESAYTGRVIWVNYGECTKRIGIDGSSDSIKEAIRSSFGLRTNRAFWLEDENEIVRSLDRDMPLTTYTLCLDAGTFI